MTDTRRLPPKEIQLTELETRILASLTFQQQSAMDFWKSAFAARGIICPQGRVCMMVRVRKDKFLLEWHPKPLGPKAIAAGRDYRAFAERKDREFAAKRAVSP